MSPMYNFDPTKDEAGFPVYPKGDYLMLIGTPKAFQRNNEAGELTYGVKFPMTIVENTDDPKHNGKKATQYQYFAHSDGGRNFGKGFILAAYGYEIKDEKAFNEKATEAQMDWSFDPDTGNVGDAWKALDGQRVWASMSVKINPKNKTEGNNYDSFRPFVPTEAVSVNAGDIATVQA